ncbi:aldo/keto reductase [Curtobacterium citreum]|uniref:aldo/keto reductase n=1 Tax=Curtobacterium citreum TaxID=2036 RepID=UPI00254AE112|nr:aldo/keto reductase [Curtobacterium citreum]MDK8171003.1 aldo/keto reductase [Curtobacterium citreum]
MTLLGTSSIDVFPLALGGNTFGWTSDEATSQTVLDAYLAGGGNFIDTADGYSAWVPGNSGGESETIIGNWTSSRRNRADIVIGTKVSQHPAFRGLAAANVRGAADASLQRLRTDYIDVYYAHFDDPGVPLEETIEAFDALRTAGKIREVGVSNYSPERLQEWIDIATRRGFALPVALQPHYNLVKRSEYETGLAPVVAAHQLGVVPYFALASGFLTGKYRSEVDLRGASREQMANAYMSAEGLAVVEVLDRIATAREVAIPTVALAWLRSRPGVAAPIASARTVEQLPALLASATFELTELERSDLNEASARVNG